MPSKRAAIYNRWLATLGGGEKHSLAIAEFLSRKYQVEFISHIPVPPKLAAERLNLQLSRVHFRFIPELSVLELPHITKEYDLFINASHLDFFPSFARFSAALIYFPDKLSLPIGIRRGLKSSIHTWLDMPLLVAGVQKFSAAGKSYQWYLDSIVKIRLPSSAHAYKVCFDLSELDVRTDQIRLFLGDEPCEAIVPHSYDSVRIELAVPPSPQSRSLTFFLEGDFKELGRPRAVLSNLELDLPKYRFFRTLFERNLNGLGARLYYYSRAYAILNHLDTYQMLWANSAFTQKWIRKYWRRESQVLYPPVDLTGFRAGQKGSKILSVGRFFAGNHNKKHLEMVTAFKSMVDKGLRGWELHLVGNLATGEEHESYFHAVRKSATGYPIFIHPDLPFTELADLYAESAIYWHASGYGENEKRSPEKFEHFGITTVEAMASGCVPVVIGKGGQTEIVDHGKNGFLWLSLDELKKYTERLIQDESYRQTLAMAALRSSKKFSQASFQARMEEFLRQITSGSHPGE